MVKYFIFSKDYKIDDKTYYTEGVELHVKEKHGIEYVSDGCFSIFRVDSDTAKSHGTIVNRLY